MTKAQIWIAAFVGLFIVLFFLQRLTAPKESIDETPGMGSKGSQTVSGQGIDPKIAVQQFSCVTCHGPDLKGSGSGPSLVGLSSYYTSEKLLAFLRNPNAYQSEPRHQERTGKYPSPMPSYNNKDEKDLTKLAEYLLTL